MNRSSLTQALADLDDVIARLRDAGAIVSGLERERMRLEPLERASYPPDVTREHFRSAREHAAEALRRLKRDA